MFRRRRAEDGFSILEVVIALTVLAVSAAAFATTTSHGFGLVGTSKERQTAVSLANEWMEQARAMPYSGVALKGDGLTFEGSGTPDEDVSGTTYTGEFGEEELVIESGGGGLEHVAAAPNTTNGVAYTLYRYVTWVEDGLDTQAYKRVTVVAQWHGTKSGDTPERMSMNTIVSADGVAFPDSVTTTSTSSATTSTTTTTVASTTTTVAGSCDGDSTAPTGTIRILAGTGANTGYTSSSTANLVLTGSDPCAPLTMAFSNDGLSYSAAEAFATSRAWAMTSGNGDKSVYVRFTDGAGNDSVGSAAIRVDGTAPTTPGSFTATAETGPKRVVLTWTASTDNDTLIGYRIYVASGSGSFQNQSSGVNAPCSTNPCTWTHTGVKNGDVYTYYVVAYDAAGNESAHTTHRTVTV